MAEKIKEKEKKTGPPAHWRPLAELSRWERDMERIFGEFLGRAAQAKKKEVWTDRTGGAEQQG